MQDKHLDVVTIGRVSVDLYGEQVGGRLQDMASFAKYVGGCPANIAIGTARLGLKSALLSRVGEEHLGEFIKEQLIREGVDVTRLRTDPERLTALVLLGIRDLETFPLIFYRENCADQAMDETDIDEAFIAAAKAVVVTGTHFSRPNLARASKLAMEFAKRHGGKIIFDIDYRPVLWGVAAHKAGEERFIESGLVTDHLLSVVGECDLIVGTEEEFHIAGGATDTISALRKVREHSRAALVCKRGPMGCVIFPDAIPDRLDDGILGPAFPVEVYNVLGAGDAFMSGFLRGYLRGLPWTECARFANACGAIVVSRHGCAPASPSWAELKHFLEDGSPYYRLREDRQLTHIHWATTRRESWPEVTAFAFDHRSWFEEEAARNQKDMRAIADFKELCFAAALKAGENHKRTGIICDGRFGQSVLAKAAGYPIWLARSIEWPGSRPLRFEGGWDPGVILREWPVNQIAKCLCFYHPDDDLSLRQEQEDQLLMLFEACRATQHELLLEIIPHSSLSRDSHTIARALTRLYEIGLRPDWWKLQAFKTDAEWEEVSRIIHSSDPHCRGVILLGLDAPLAEFGESFAMASRHSICKGFAIGRTIFGEVAKDWLADRISNQDAKARMAERFAELLTIWQQTRA